MPGLAAIARDILYIPAAGVSLEYIFNQSRDVCYYQKGYLVPATIWAQIISNFHLRKELYNNSIKAITDTIDIDSISTKELEEEAEYYTNNLAKALDIEYISNTDSDFLCLYKKTVEQEHRRAATKIN